MPWAERDRMSLRQELVHLVATQRVAMTELDLGSLLDLTLLLRMDM